MISSYLISAWPTPWDNFDLVYCDFFSSKISSQVGNGPWKSSATQLTLSLGASRGQQAQIVIKVDITWRNRYLLFSRHKHCCLTHATSQPARIEVAADGTYGNPHLRLFGLTQLLCLFCTCYFSTNTDAVLLLWKGIFAPQIIWIFFVFQPRPGPTRVGMRGSTVYIPLFT